MPSQAQSYTITDLGAAQGTPQGNDIDSTPYGLNNFGEAVGTSAGPSSPAATLFSNGTATFIGLGITPFGINDSGEIVGEGPPSNSSGNFDAFIYSNGKITDINSRAIFPYGSQAAAVNINGQVIGTGYTVATQSPPFHAFLYSGGKMTDINPPGSYSSFGVAINDSGQILCAATNPAGEYHAVLLTLK